MNGLIVCKVGGALIWFKQYLFVQNQHTYKHDKNRYRDWRGSHTTYLKLLSQTYDTTVEYGANNHVQIVACCIYYYLHAVVI